MDAPSAAKAQTGWSGRRDVSAELQLRLRPIGLALRATPGASGSLPFLLRRFRFSNPGAAKNGGEHRIPFVAGPLVDWPF